MEQLNIRALRTSAGALLSRGKNRVTMILAQAVLMLAVVLCLMLFYAFSLLCRFTIFFRKYSNLYELYRKMNSDGKLSNALITATGNATPIQSGEIKNRPKMKKPVNTLAICPISP